MHTNNTPVPKARPVETNAFGSARKPDPITRFLRAIEGERRHNRGEEPGLQLAVRSLSSNSIAVARTSRKQDVWRVVLCALVDHFESRVDGSQSAAGTRQPLAELGRFTGQD